MPSIHASHLQAAESTIPNRLLSICHAFAEPPTHCGWGGGPGICHWQRYVIVFGSEARRDSFIQQMDGEAGPCPDDPAQLIPFLNDHAEHAEALIWTLEMELPLSMQYIPMALLPATAYERLRDYLDSQRPVGRGGEGVERVSIPGVIVGKIRLFSGQVVPVIMPAVYGNV